MPNNQRANNDKDPAMVGERSSRQSTYGEGIRNPRARQRALCIACATSEPDLAELRELLRTAGVAVAGEMTQVRPEPHPDTYLGSGKLEELKKAADAANANVIACDDELSPRQERSIEEAVGLPVVDRTEIILDIFAGHARSAEGKLQVELAQLQYNLSRMRGLWTHLERLGGGIGTRGPGESQIETDRRLARDRITALRRRLEHVRSARTTQRRERERANLPTVALAGYTNAGKSSLLNALTGSDVIVRDRLFETLDPTTRNFEIDGRRILLTDTVGFIRKLPHQVVDAFSATLEEAYSAQLVLHIVDASMEDDELAEMIKAVDDVLEEIGIVEQESHLVLNKIDLVSDARRLQLQFRHPEASLVSAQTGDGLPELLKVVEQKLSARLVQVQLLIPHGEGQVLTALHEHGAKLTREDRGDGVLVNVQLPLAMATRFSHYNFQSPPLEAGELTTGKEAA
ncbi:MAG: GTPase HflX [Thermoleophilaceae bacterium]|nr:GTPase HflX [Thermoleophilaceae bacterium]